jgi:SAM-dependent methyltransferase
LRFGRISSSTPLSKASGFDRGKPIDRYYIERFLASHSSDIRGRVLEVGDDAYSREFAGGPILQQDVLHIDDSNPKATLIGDLSVPGLLPSKAYDCIILTQTLQYVFDVPVALEQIHDALRPGGVLLLTAPGIAPISLDDWQDSFYWRFTAHSLERLLSAVFDPARVDVSPFGNLYAAAAFLHGAAVQETSSKKLQPVMPEYAIVICARAVA